MHGGSSGCTEEAQDARRKLRMDGMRVGGVLTVRVLLDARADRTELIVNGRASPGRESESLLLETPRRTFRPWLTPAPQPRS